jgi:hypothetical protein
MSVQITGAEKQFVTGEGGFFVYAFSGFNPQFFGPYENEAEARTVAENHAKERASLAVVLPVKAWYAVK